MMNIREEIKKSVTKTLKSLGYGEEYLVKVLKPKEASFGDYSVSVAMEIAKKEGKNPSEIASQIKGFPWQEISTTSSPVKERPSAK